MSTFEQIRRRKLENLTNDLDKAAKGLPAPTADDQLILSSTACSICHKIKSRECTALQVTAAFSRQALESHKRLNFITECLILEALEIAAERDREQASGKSLKALHGLPISIKDHFDVRGVDSSLGISSLCDKPAQDDCFTVQLLRSNGAILMYKTNVPQTMMTNECANPIFGITRNPLNPDFTSGGSSGGEGAALASNSTPLGYGSDIAGSLHFPVAFCGGYTIKSSAHRLPTLGTHGLSSTHLNEAINVSLGPMARSVQDVAMAIKLIIESEPWKIDAGCLRIPWSPVDKDVKEKPLHFGYYLDDTWTKSSPAVKRSVRETISKLRSAGHICTEFVPPRVPEIAQTFVGLMSADGNQIVKRILHKDPYEKNVAMSMTFPTLWRPLRLAIGWFIRTYYQDDKMASLLGAYDKKTVQDVWLGNVQRNNIRQFWVDHVWSQGFDAIICPTYPIPAMGHGESREILAIAASTFIYNFLDYTVGVIPVGKVRDTDTIDGDASYSGWQGIFHAALYTGFRGQPPVYRPQEMEGLNLSVQIVGRVTEEEKILAIMEVVDAIVKGKP